MPLSADKDQNARGSTSLSDHKFELAIDDDTVKNAIDIGAADQARLDVARRERNVVQRAAQQKPKIDSELEKFLREQLASNVDSRRDRAVGCQPELTEHPLFQRSLTDHGRFGEPFGDSIAQQMTMFWRTVYARDEHLLVSRRGRA